MQYSIWTELYQGKKERISFYSRYQEQQSGYSVFGFDPINLNTGNFIYEKEDLKIRGITTLSFHITYNFMEEYSGGSLGEGWHHNYEISIEDNEEGYWNE